MFLKLLSRSEIDYIKFFDIDKIGVEGLGLFPIKGNYRIGVEAKLMYRKNFDT